MNTSKQMRTGKDNVHGVTKVVEGTRVIMCCNLAHKAPQLDEVEFARWV